MALAATAPAASAETATFSGTCALTGTSTFDPPLTGTHQMIKYDFKSGAPAEGEADGTKCSGTLNGKPVTDTPVKANVAGEGDLSCSSGESTAPGQGAIVFPDGSTFDFGFTFTAVATEVDFEAVFAGGTSTTGHASFLHYAPPTSGFDCSPAGGGIKALGFDATTDESSTPIQGTKPDAGAQPQPDSGPAPPSGESPQGTEEQKPSAAKRRKACMKKASKIKNKKRRAKAKRRCKRIK
jgi:hypothetical protein